MLAAQHGGQIVARERNGRLIPQQAVYRVMLQVEGNQPGVSAGHALRGRVVINGEGKSLLGDYLRTAATVVLREAGW
jgi:putative peptide zinc metalloprotease protein